MKRSPGRIPSRRRHGFTLTEVLLVLAILGVIAALVVPNLIGQQGEAYKRQTRVNIAALEKVADQYAVDHDGDYPPNLNELLKPQPGADGKTYPVYIEKVPKDAWNTPLSYEFPNNKGGNPEKPAIWSAGKDKQDGTGDDITNWQQ